MMEYGKLFQQLHIIIFTKRFQNLKLRKSPKMSGFIRPDLGVDGFIHLMPSGWRNLNLVSSLKENKCNIRSRPF